MRQQVNGVRFFSEIRRSTGANLNEMQALHGLVACRGKPGGYKNTHRLGGASEYGKGRSFMA